MNLKRIFRHLLSTSWQLKRAFPEKTLAAIEQEIQASEANHTGEIRFAVEGALPGWPLYRDQSARERAIDVFSQLRMWDTDARNGVLIYLLLADHAVEIVADRGVHAKAGALLWEKICHAMEQAFHQGCYEQGVQDGVREVNHFLMQHFPAQAQETNKNELPNKVVVL